MKFGKSIGSQQDGNVELHYVDYKLLKKRIKDVVEQLQAHELNKALRANTEFEVELEAEIDQVNTCFATKQKQLLEQTSTLAEELQAVQQASRALASASSAAPEAQASSSLAAEGRAGGGGPPELAGEGPEAFRRLRELLNQVDALRKYAVWNAVAVVKILKKRRKQTHFGLEDTAAERAAWLSRQSFFSGSDFAELHTAIESLGHLMVQPPVDCTAQRQQPQLDREPQQCPICLETISDMVQLPCNHRFCWKCFVLGPIAFQPGEYRISQCPICRTETSPALASSGDVGGAASSRGIGIPSSEGILTRFLHTYCSKESLGEAEGEEMDEQARQEGEQAESEMRDVVGELVKALLADSVLPKPPKGSGALQDQLEEPGSASAAASSVPSDFFQTLPKQAPQEKQLIGAAQKLQWLQLASTGDSFALDGTMYCSLCSEPLLMEVVVSTPCKHHFHRVCISRLEEPKCPLCGHQLPFSWFLPEDHPCCETGFRVVPTNQYRPLFPGGPSRGTYGYPLHRPPPVTLRGPGGIVMKSYLHKVVPMGLEEDNGPLTPTSAAAACPMSPLTAADTPGQRASEEAADGSSASDSSSEDSNTDDGGGGDLANSPSSPKKGRSHAWAYSSVGRMRLLERSDPMEAPAIPSAVPSFALASHREKAATGSAASASASSTDMPVGTVPAAASSESEQRNPTVLLIGKHL
mmetsp:Transcript_64980/g.180190  ORF Transcript_64980/g.180190 Transcript_64980/m.180190 type:complete len:697 (-) Transcript_64980:256-2346(-)